MTLGLPLFSWQRLKPGFIQGLASIVDSYWSNHGTTRIWISVEPPAMGIFTMMDVEIRTNERIAPRYDGPSSTERRIVRRVKPGPRRAAFHVVVQHLSLCIQLLAMWKTAELNLLILLQVNRLSLHYKFCGWSSTNKNLMTHRISQLRAGPIRFQWGRRYFCVALVAHRLVRLRGIWWGTSPKICPQDPSLAPGMTAWASSLGGEPAATGPP